MGAATALLVVVVVVHVGTDLEAADLLRDVSAVAQVPWWTGAGAIVNLCLWAVAAALAAFVAGLHPSFAGTLRLFAVLSLLLLLDDLLLLHESAETQLGLSNAVFFLPYAAGALVLAWLLRVPRAGTAGWVLLAAGGLLASSVAVDLALGGIGSREVVIEDGAKLVGTALWACVPVVLHQVLSATGPAGATGPTGPAGTRAPGQQRLAPTDR